MLVLVVVVVLLLLHLFILVESLLPKVVNYLPSTPTVELRGPVPFGPWATKPAKLPFLKDLYMSL